MRKQSQNLGLKRALFPRYLYTASSDKMKLQIPCFMHDMHACIFIFETTFVCPNNKSLERTVTKYLASERPRAKCMRPLLSAVLPQAVVFA